MTQYDISKYNTFIDHIPQQVARDILIIHQRPCKKGINHFKVKVKNQKRQLYIAQRSINLSQEYKFLEQSPRFIVFSSYLQTLVLEQSVQQYLTDYILRHQEDKIYSMPENQAQQIMEQLNFNFSAFSKHKDIQYKEICAQNVVKYNGKWVFSAVGNFLGLGFGENYRSQILKSTPFQFGCLLFKILFGFAPYQKNNNKPIQWSVQLYLNYLLGQHNQSFLKTYYFASKLLFISKQAINLLEKSLSNKMKTFKQWCEHQFFQKPRDFIAINKDQIQIKMINRAGKKHQSLVFAAIQQRNNNKNKVSRIFLSPDEQSYKQVQQKIKKNQKLKGIRFTANIQEPYDNLKSSSFRAAYQKQRYFHDQKFDPETDKPCQQLLIFLQENQQVYYEKHSKQNRLSRSQREAELKLYAYPYTMIFQLAKFQNRQSIKIRQTINILSEFLLQLSQLYYPIFDKPKYQLHRTQKKVNNFDDIKSQFRSYINKLYHHFLGEAIKKYNIKNDKYTWDQRQKLKDQGLQYYRLCLKLMELSVLVRKQGHNLDLSRIETLERKGIQLSLDQLLKKYFPNKIES